MSLLEKRFLLLNTENTNHVGAATLPYDSTRTIKDVLDPLINPGLRCEYITVDAAAIANKYVQLADAVAREGSVLVHPVGGVPQGIDKDFSVAVGKPSYINWAGLNLEQHLAVGDTLVVAYEVEGVPLGVPGETATDTPSEGGGGFAPPEKVTTDYTVTTSATLLADSSTGLLTIDLPSAADSESVTLVVKKTAGMDDVVVSPYGTDTIDGSTEELSLSVINTAVTLLCDGEGWHIV